MTAAAKKSWFDVDKEGLAKILERRGTAKLDCVMLRFAIDEELLSSNLLNIRQVFVRTPKKPSMALNFCPFCGVKR